MLLLLKCSIPVSPVKTQVVESLAWTMGLLSYVSWIFLFICLNLVTGASVGYEEGRAYEEAAESVY